MNKKFNIDFYKIHMPNQSGKPFESILQQVVQLPIQDRFREVNQSPIFLHQASHGWRNYCWEGEIIRLRMDSLPVKSTLAGDVEELFLKDDEGIGEQTTFFYNTQTRVLLLQATQSGVTISAFIKYFQLMINLIEDIYVDPVIQASAVQKLAQMQEISKFEVQVAGLDKMDIFKNTSYGVKEIVNLTDSFFAPVISLNLSVGRKKRESLSLDMVKDTALDLLRISSHNKREIKKIRISGSSNDSDNIYIDLLKDRMRESIDIKKSRRISYSDRIQAIRDGWQHREQELFKMFGAD